MKYLVFFLGGALALNLDVNNVSAHELEPGLYEIKVRVELPNVIDPAHEALSRRCITRADLSRHDPFQIESETPLKKCQRTPICMGGAKAGFQVVCGGGTGGVADGQFTLSNNQFSGTIKMNMGGKNMTVVERQSGRRVGDCRN